MDIPLPQPGPGGFAEGAVGAGNALTTQALTNAQLGLQNQYLNATIPYAPYNAYADAYSKMIQAQFLPYTQLMSNPMFLLNLQQHPEQAQAMLGQLSNVLPKPGQMPGGMNIPLPGQNQQQGSMLGPVGNAFNAIKNLFNGNNKSNNSLNNNMQIPMPGMQNGFNNSSQNMPVNNLTSNGSNNPADQMNQQGSPLVPATTGGGIGGFLGQATGKNYAQNQAPGATFTTPQGGLYSAPGAREVSVVQNQLLSTQRVEPQLERLAKEWSPFMDLKGMAELTGTKVGNAVSSLLPSELEDKLGNSELPSQYAKAKATTNTAPESLLKSYGLNPTNETIERMTGVIEPEWGETPQTYKNRILSQLQEIKNEQEIPTANALGRGFDVSGNSNSSPAQQAQPQSVPEGTKKVLNGITYTKKNGLWHKS